MLKDKYKVKLSPLPLIHFFVFSCLLHLMICGPAYPQDDTFVKPKETPTIITDPEVLDFGEVIEGEIITKKLKIKNKGKGNLDILKIGFTCGCTIPQIVLPNGKIVVPEKRGEARIGTLKADESAELELQLKTLGLRGPVKRKLSIYSNDPLNRKHSINVNSTVKPAFRFEPRTYEFGSIQKTSTATKTATIRSLEGKDFQITEIPNLPNYMTYSVEYFKEEHEGKLSPCAKLTLAMTGDLPIGNLSIKLRAKVDSEKAKECNLIIYANVLPPVTFKCGNVGPSDICDFGVLPKGKGASREIEIINDNPSIPYDIAKVDFSSKYEEFIDIELITLDPGIHYKIEAVVKPDIDARFFRGTIILHSTHPDLPKKSISLKGWISKE